MDFWLDNRKTINRCKQKYKFTKQNFLHTYSWLENKCNENGRITVIGEKVVKEQTQKGQRSLDSLRYLGMTFQHAIFKVLEVMQISSGMNKGISFEEYVQVISNRYNVPIKALIGKNVWLG